jgi:Family of unknown function (DUF6011)
MPSTVQELVTVLPALPPSQQSFAASLIEQSGRRALSEKQMFWVNKLVQQASQPAPAAPATAQIGDLSGITALFDKARRHLKFPAIVMSVPAASRLVRINVAGERARFPGTLNVTSGEKPTGEGREWFGRVKLNGTYEPSARASEISAAITARLVEFAADPARVASEHGKLVGRCCFCNIALTDERSTAVGYGKICAEHYGLSWGER